MNLTKHPKLKFKVPVFLRKLVVIARRVSQLLRFTGARESQLTESGMATVVLNRSYPLGAKGSEINLVKDQMIYEFVKLRGKWEIDESKFLASQLRILSSMENPRKTAMIDIGANTGLVTLQAMNLANTDNDYILIEPSALHVRQLKKNFQYSRFRVQIKEFALSDSDGKAQLFTQESNQGNSSLLEIAVPPSEKTAQEVWLRDTEDFFQEELSQYEKIVIKSDTQGYDALILSKIPASAWSKVQAAVIEVWALPSINKSHVETLMDEFSKFSKVSWNPGFTNHVSSSELANFWLSKTSSSRNLFISK
jgi:FkbM family methyltransferase